MYMFNCNNNVLINKRYLNILKLNFDNVVTFILRYNYIHNCYILF